jgi:hypothetical protein
MTDKLVILDGRVTDEKLAELLDLQTEHPMLDFKQVIDLTSTPGVVELAKDVGAFQVAGGYIIGGVDGHGVPNGQMDGCDPRPFDSANLVPKLTQFLPKPLAIHSRVTEWKGHTVVIFYIEPHPDGYAVFKAVGQYPKPGGKNGEMKVVFRESEIFWRDGTRSVRISQQGLREVIARRVAYAKTEWMEEQQLRQREREAIEAGYAGRELARAPLGTMNLGASAEELRLAVLELIRADDQVGLLYLLNDAQPRAASAIQRDQIENELAELLDKLAAIAADALEYEQEGLFRRIIGLLAQIYSSPLGPHDDRRFSMSTGIDPQEKAPRVFLEVLERIYGLGALAVRLRRWEAIRELTLQSPDQLDDYWKNWLRHGLTMASRAQQFTETRDGGQKVEVSLLTLAAQVIDRVPSLHADTDDQDAILTSLAQFDFLANLAAIDGSDSADSSVFYTNWARFRQERIQSVADRIITDRKVRQAIFRDHDDDDLALALRAVAKVAHEESIRYDGFWGWDRTPVGSFLEAHPPPAQR